MTSQNKVTAAVVQYVFPEKGLITVKHGKADVSFKFFLVFFFVLFFLLMVIVETIKRLFFIF